MPEPKPERNPRLKFLRQMLYGIQITKSVILNKSAALDLNGHALVIRHRAHVGRKGWPGRVVDAVGGGTITWCKGGMAIMIR